MRSKTLKAMALGGIVGPILFTVVATILAYLRPNYEHLHHFISELGATNTPFHRLMNLSGFIISGLFFSAFAIALLIKVPKKGLSKFGASLFFIFAIGMILAGIFSCDPGCPQVGSLESTIHDRVSAITFFSAILGILLLGLAFRKSGVFRSISLYTMISGILSAILLVVMINSFESREFTGLWQRLLLAVIFLWTTIVAIRIYKTTHYSAL